jgi:hypothetical protein
MRSRIPLSRTASSAHQRTAYHAGAARPEAASRRRDGGAGGARRGGPRGTDGAACLWTLTGSGAAQRSGSFISGSGRFVAGWLLLLLVAVVVALFCCPPPIGELFHPLSSPRRHHRSSC